jgi:hypothetical protein
MFKRSNMRKRPHRNPSGMKTTLAIAGMCLMTVSCAWAVTKAAPEPATSGGPATFRRLNQAQYQRSVEDIFGAGIKIPGRFEPPVRDEGLLAIGDSNVVVTPSGFEQYEIRSRDIAAQVLSADRRKTLVPCEPSSLGGFDVSCASQFLGKYGRLLFRHPLTDRQMTSVLNVARTAAESSGDFYKGLQYGLASLLVSPAFIFRMETTEPAPDGSGALRLDAYSLASRISFLLWDAPPDAALLDAAASGVLHDSVGLERQVSRMIASPRFEQGVRAFFSDMFGYDQFEGLAKDQAIFYRFTSQLSQDAEEQSLRTIVDLLVTNRGDYRDLFTTRKTFVNRNLSSLYRVPVNYQAFNGGWMPYTFGPDDHRAGLLSLAGFLMLDPSHEGRSSPTIRGKTVRELFLCQKVPAPPANVNFTIVQDTNNPLYKTARDRLTAHRDNPTCAGCHKITDPIGLGMENYDAIGQFRAEENGALIDASGTFDNKPYKDAIELGQLLRNSPAVPTCVVRRAFEYGVGRTATTGEQDWLKQLNQRFADDKYAFPALLRRIATSKAFQAVTANDAARVGIAAN